MRTKIVTLLCIIVLITTAFTASTFQGLKEEQTAINIIRNAEQYTCKIESENAYGSGVLVSDSKVVTSLHVIKSEKIVVIFSDFSRHNAVIVKKDIEHDIVLLEIEPTQRKFVHFGNEIIKGQRVLVFGCPDGYDFSVSEGIVSSEYRNLMSGIPDVFQIDATLDHGNSGGAIVNTKGELIGIVNCKLKNVDGIGFANRIHIIKKLLEPSK